MVEEGRERTDRLPEPIIYGVLLTEPEARLMIQAAEEAGGVTIAITGKPGDFYKDVPIYADPEVIAEAEEIEIPEEHLYLTINVPPYMNIYTAFQHKFIELCSNYSERIRAVEETKIEY